MMEKIIGDPELISSSMKEASDIVYNMIDLDKR